MSSAARSRGAQQAAMHMHELLLTTYRAKWREHSYRSREGKVNALAVATVVADYVATHPTPTRGDGTESRNIKDLVYRAFSGQGLSLETLTLMIKAFSISDADAVILQDLWDGTAKPRILVGTMAPREAPGPPYQTVQRHEFHYLGAEGQPVRHRTVQGIKALVDGYDTHRYVFDTSEAEVERVHGGTPSKPYQISGNLWAVDIKLPAVLNCGDTVSMEYITKFHHASPLLPNFRYAAHQRVTDIMWRVEFHPDRLPTRVEWTEWRDYRPPDDVIFYSEPVKLDSEHAVYRHLEFMESATAGFAWCFDMTGPR